MKSVKIFAFVFLFWLLFSDQVAIASAPTITTYPSSINIDQSFTISATMSGLSSNTIYRLRIVLAQTGTTNYFGSTYNGSEWYNGTPSPIDYTKFLTITTFSDGSWYGNVQGMVANDDPNFNNTGSGTYDLELGRYTENGSSATWSNVVNVSLTAPSPTPTSTPTPTPTPAPTSTPTLTPIPTLTVTPTPKSTITPTPYATTSAVINPAQQQVLSQNTNSLFSIPSDTGSPGNSLQLFSAADKQAISKILIFLGIIFMSLCAIVIFYPKIDNYLKARKNGDSNISDQ